MSDPATRTARLQAAHDKLQDAVQSIVTGEDWQKMLRTAAKFYRYSSGGITYSKLLNSYRSAPDRMASS
jgi:hypothetical protein